MSSHQSVISCQTCGEPVEAGWERCPACLTPTVSSQLTCRECGKEIKSKWKQCPYCKATLDGWETPTGNTTTTESSQNKPSQRMGLTMGGDLSGDAEDSGLDFVIDTGELLVDRYTVRKLLGAGSFGAVYLASDSVLQKDIALKIVKNGEGKAQRAIEQLLHEFQLREKITDTRYILRSYDPRQAEYKNLPILLLPVELAASGSFRQWMMKNPQKDNRFKQGLDYFGQACQGVQAIHEAGLVHLDMKPDNILIVDGTAKIADFGIGRFGASHFSDNPEQLLRQGVGTPQYMSPEQFKVARQKDIGPKSDIYSLGIILYELLDGNPPFDGSPVELRDKHLEMEPSPLIGPAEPWWRIVKKCLAKNNEDRYASVEQLLRDLQRAAEGLIITTDVSCPQCGHINGNPNARACENCEADLTALFRLCPTCKRQVRLDVDLCPGCGKNVAKHYWVQMRKEVIEQVKDEDPVEAIELLETVLREGADEYQERAVALVRELRDQQDRVNVLMDDAEKARTDGDLELALQKFQDVLHIIPRHKVALQKRHETDAVLQELQEQRVNASRLADDASFREAETLLHKCLKRAPAHSKTKELLQCFPEREKSYTTNINAAESTIRNKQIHQAQKHVSYALSAAPKSKTALALKVKISAILDSTKQHFDKAQGHLNAAEFELVEDCLVNIEAVQLDCANLEEWKALFRQTKTRFTTKLQKAAESKASLDLYTAKEYAGEALQICPKSNTAKQVLASIQALQHDVKTLFEEANRQLQQCQFKLVKQTINKIESIWCNYEELDDLKKRCGVRETGFIQEITHSKKLLDQNLFQSAEQTVSAAIRSYGSVDELVELNQEISDKRNAFHERERRQKKQIKIAFQLSILTLIVVGLYWSIHTHTEFWNKVNEYAEKTLVSLLSSAAWSWFTGHTSLLFYAAVGMVILSVCVHYIRQTRYLEKIISSVQLKISGIRGTLTALLFAECFIAIIPTGLAIGVYWYTQSHFHFSKLDANTLSLIVLDSFLILSVLYSLVAQQSSDRTGRYDKKPPILDHYEDQKNPFQSS